jgi:hypothetical protein
MRIDKKFMRENSMTFNRSDSDNLNMNKKQISQNLEIDSDEIDLGHHNMRTEKKFLEGNSIGVVSTSTFNRSDSDSVNIDMNRKQVSMDSLFDTDDIELNQMTEKKFIDENSIIVNTSTYCELKVLALADNGISNKGSFSYIFASLGCFVISISLSLLCLLSLLMPFK